MRLRKWVREFEAACEAKGHCPCQSSLRDLNKFKDDKEAWSKLTNPNHLFWIIKKVFPTFRDREGGLVSSNWRIDHIGSNGINALTTLGRLYEFYAALDYPMSKTEERALCILIRKAYRGTTGKTMPDFRTDLK